MYVNNISELAADLVRKATERGIMIATAESCTGGLLSAAITSISGSSAIFDCGFITYSNKAKTEILGVPPSLIAEYGAVSENVAKAMAIGAKQHSCGANIAISITGIAGPGGGSETKPVGLVWVAINFYDKIYTFENFFSGNREEIRAQSVCFCLITFLQLLADVNRAS